MLEQQPEFSQFRVWMVAKIISNMSANDLKMEISLQMCRTCMGPIDENAQNLIQNNNLTECSKNVEFCLLLKIHPEDNLPDKICDNCFKLIDNFASFKKQCLLTDETLRKLQFEEIQETNVQPLIINVNDITFQTTSDEKKDVVIFQDHIRRIKKVDINDVIKPKIINCNNCKQTFKTDYQKRLHNCYNVNHVKTKTCLYKQMNQGVILKCDICNRIFTNELLLSLHFFKHGLIHHSLKDPNIVKNCFTCFSCGERFNEENDLAQHKLTHEFISDEIYNCVVCACKFTSELDVLKHEHFKHPTSKGGTCPMCGLFFNTKHNLYEHASFYLISKYNCRKCDRRYCTASALHLHKRSHPDYLGYECNFCDKDFASAKGLYDHKMLAHHKTKRVDFICVVCGLKFRTRSALSMHKRKHLGKNFGCKICDYKCTDHSSLIVHIRVHTGEKPYKCTYGSCDKSFRTTGHLNEHLRTHVRNSFKCDKCVQVFNKFSTFKQHVISHEMC